MPYHEGVVEICGGRTHVKELNQFKPRIELCKAVSAWEALAEHVKDKVQYRNAKAVIDDMLRLVPGSAHLDHGATSDEEDEMKMMLDACLREAMDEHLRQCEVAVCDAMASLRPLAGGWHVVGG